MKIWLDATCPSTVSRNYRIYSEREDDCPEPDTQGIAARKQGGSVLTAINGRNRVQQQVLALNTREPLYVQSLDAAHWLVSNPTQEGYVAVLDAEAYALLQCFQQPMRGEEAIARTACDTSGAVKMLQLLVAANFLHTEQQPALATEEHFTTLHAWLHITNSCNLGCTYCYIRKSTEHMSDTTARRSIEAILRSALKHAYQRIKLKYAGGEASLRLQHIFDIHDYALRQTQEHCLALAATLLSNGVFITQESIAQLKQRQINVMISLDGIGTHHDVQRPFLNGKGSFKMVDRTITRLLDNELVPSINVTVSQHNLAHLPELLSYILERDLPFTLSYYRENEHAGHQSTLQFSEQQMIDGMRAAFSYIEAHLPARTLLNSLIDKASLEISHQFTCGVGNNYLVIDQQGDIAKCQADISHTVTSINADDPLHALRTDRSGVQAVAVDDKEGCRDCQWRYWCTGGCPTLTYRLTGRSDIKSPNCGIYQALFPEVLRLEALRLLTYEQPLVF